MELLYWITLYYGVLNNLFGEERQAAVAVIDDDAAFDRWLVEFERQKANQAAEAARRQNGGQNNKPRMKVMSKERFIKEFDVEFKR
jgi:hypothetical protein